MRWVAIAVVMCACGPSAEPAAPTAPVPTCTSAAEHIIDELVAGKDPRPPDDAINGQIKIVREHCEKDAWSEQARACFTRMKGLADADQCGTYLTPEQQTALGPPPPPPAAE
ncbi:MAG TPA: hypothetical protein VGM39_17355 [Kofleriaceae bacterium]|jgi:hypothetical protein